MSSDTLLAELVAGLAEVHEKLVTRARDAETLARANAGRLVVVEAALETRQGMVEDLLDQQREDRQRIAELEEAARLRAPPTIWDIEGSPVLWAKTEKGTYAIKGVAAVPEPAELYAEGTPPLAILRVHAVALANELEATRESWDSHSDGRIAAETATRRFALIDTMKRWKAAWNGKPEAGR